MIRHFETSLLRERFVIYDPGRDLIDKAPITALSNRMEIKLQTNPSRDPEIFIVRTQNMHSCVRFSLNLIQDYLQKGSLMTRLRSADWEQLWRQAEGDYERMFNHDRWAAVYHRGAVMFQKGHRHSLLDLIEKCAFESNDSYDQTVYVAERAFENAGKSFKINHNSNVALVVNIDGNEGRCGVIFRGANHSNTFNFKVIGSDNELVNIPQCLSACAAFLEGIQLSFMVGINREKIRRKKNTTQEAKQTKEAAQRLARLDAEITNLESSYKIRYRPEKPDFREIIKQTERMANSFLE